jgi:hypothetical protein
MRRREEAKLAQKLPSADLYVRDNRQPKFGHFLLPSPKATEFAELRAFERKLDWRGGANTLGSVSDLLWFVAHTRPRPEKKPAQFRERARLAATWPCSRAAHKRLDATDLEAI